MAVSAKPSFARPRVIVIGAGLMGLWPAALLAEAGCTVHVLEAGAAARGASWAAAGMLAPASEAAEAGHESASTLDDFSLHSLALWRDWAARFDAAGQDICWRPFGALQTAFGEAGMHQLQRNSRAASALGLTPQVLDAHKARQMEPALADGVRGALFIKEEASVDPRLVLTALRALLADVGGRVQTGVRVRALARSGRGLQVLCRNGDALDADAVVLAAGFAAGAIDGAGLAGRLAPVKGQMLALQTEAPVRAVIRDARAYLVPRGKGRMVIGATSEPGLADDGTDARTLARLHQGAAAIVPALKDAKMTACWAGVRPQSRDGLPLIGALDVPGLYANCGHYRNGVLLAPASAALIRALVLDEDAGAFARAFAPARPGTPC